jgi:spore germination protein KB
MLQQYIGADQFRKLVIMFSIGNSILLLPALLAEEAKQDAWIATIFGVGIGLLIVWFYQKLAQIFPDKTLNEYIPMIFGKWLGKMIVFLFFIFSFCLSVILLRNLGEFITITTFPETPMLAIQILFSCVVIVGVLYGLENIARTCEIFMPWLYVFMLSFFLLIMVDIDVKNVQPVFENGAVPIFKGAFLLVSTSFLELGPKCKGGEW